MVSHIVVYPRMGPKRELKLAQESFWDGKSSAGDLQEVAADLSVEYCIVAKSYASHKAVTEYKDAKAGVTAFGFLVRGTKTLDLIKRDFPEGIDGRNNWSSDLAASLETLEGIVGKDKLDTNVSARLDAQQKKLNLPVLPTTTIGPFPQTKELRKVRLEYKAKRVSEDDCVKAIKEEIRKLVKLQEEFDIDGPKFFVIPIDNTEEEFGISPPASSRSPIPKTMRVKIMVNSHEYIALIDTGSHLNFLHPRVAREVGLKIINDDPIEVSIADGSKMYSEGSCPEFKFGIQGGQFATQAYILQVDGCDVILGIQWLMGLGQIKNWDFASLKMELTQGDRTIQIKGMDTEESEVGCSTDEKLVSMFREGVKYGAGIGPGVYDIHSPRIPSTEEIADRINKMLAVLETIQVNPDCGQSRRLSMIPAC